jgi:GTP-dependent phosphoenolpyruvate carboxykinase
MSTTVSVEPKTTIEAPFKEVADVKEKQSMFILYYRQGMNPHTMFMFFFASGPFNQIISRAKNHCEIMNYRFVTVRPAITNFEEEEKKLNRVSD